MLPNILGTMLQRPVSKGRARSTAVRFLAAVSLLIGLSFSSTANAQVRVSIGSIELGGELDSEFEEEVTNAIIEGLGRAEILVTARESSGEVQVWVNSTLTMETQLYSIEIELVRASDSVVLSAESGVCEICSRSEALGAVALTAEALTESFPGLAVVEVTPDGAWLAIDGVTVQPGSAVALMPGSYPVVATLEEHSNAERELTIRSNEITEMSLILDPLAEDVGRGDGRPLWLAGWIVGGVGLATLTAGGVLWGVDGQICDPDSPVDSAGNCARLYETWREGVALTAIGIGAVSAAVILLIIDRLRRNPTTSRRLTLAREWSPFRGYARNRAY